MKITEDTERKIFLGSAASLLVLAGILLGAYAPPVKSLAEKAGDKVEDIRRNGLAYLGLRPSGHLAPLRAEIFSSIAPDASRAAPGVTLITGLFGDKLAARLYDQSGAITHEWPVDLFGVFPDEKKYRFDALVHGDFLYPNGDLLVVIDQVGMAKISACGEIIWKKKNGAHHSIEIDDDGFIWAPRGGKTYHEPRFADVPVRIDRIAKIDPATGEEVESIELARVLLDAGLEGVVKGNRLRPDDVFHLNDVEVLKKSMAPAFPMFAAGDIMISGRNTNEIMVLDGKTRQIKWWRAGPMHGQHDPDFQPNGEITLLDNRTAAPASKKNNFMGGAGGSRIIAIDPATYGYRELYASNARNAFYTDYRGKHQMLDNGNILIAESAAGRAFEATPDGEIAFMVVSKYDDKSAGWLTSAARYPESYAAVGKNCPAQ